jgi:hypothetical protein
MREIVLYLYYLAEKAALLNCTFSYKVHHNRLGLVSWIFQRESPTWYTYCRFFHETEATDCRQRVSCMLLPDVAACHGLNRTKLGSPMRSSVYYICISAAVGSSRRQIVGNKLQR